MSIFQSKVDCIHTQIESIVRYFNCSFRQEHARGKIYKLVNKINKPTKLNNLTDAQFNITMHHLRKLERKMYIYYWTREAIERDLSRRLLDIDLTLDDSEFTHGFINPEYCEKIQRHGLYLKNRTEDNRLIVK